MSWKPLLVAALVFAAASPSPAATLDRSAAKQDRSGTLSKEDARRAIAIFKRGPLSAQGELTRPIILKFAEDTPDAEITISPKRMAWINDRSVPQQTAQILVVAYMAGDIESQLNSGKAKDDPVAASEQVIATYRQLQRANPKLKVRAVEDLVTLQKQGKLADHFKGD